MSEPHSDLLRLSPGSDRQVHPDCTGRAGWFVHDRGGRTRCPPDRCVDPGQRRVRSTHRVSDVTRVCRGDHRISLSVASSTRTIDVIVRSTVTAQLEGAEVSVIIGKRSIRSVGDLLRLQTVGMQNSLATPVVGQNAPRSVLGKTRRGDLVAHIEHVRPGDLTICAGSFASDLLDPDSRHRSVAHLSQIPITCKHIGPDDTVVELAVPPQQRFD